MTNWRLAKLGPYVPTKNWQVMEVEALASTETIKWDIAKVSGTTSNTYNWRVVRLTGNTVRSVPNWRLYQVQARANTVTNGWVWAYVSGHWQRAKMHIYRSGGWYSMEPEDN